LTYIIPTRALLGFRYQFLTATRGQGVINTLFYGYDDLAQGYQPALSRSIVAREPGETTTYALRNAEERGILFYGPGVEVYEGMVVGENSKPEDISINICKKRQVTNMRQSNKEIDVRLRTPRTMSLDECIEYLSTDELLEVTPQNLRVRKRILNTDSRGKEEKKFKEMWE